FVPRGLAVSVLDIALKTLDRLRRRNPKPGEAAVGVGEPRHAGTETDPGEVGCGRGPGYERNEIDEKRSPTQAGRAGVNSFLSSIAYPGAGFLLVTDPEGVGAVVAAVEDSGGPVGLDTETTGLNHAADRVRLLQIATPKGTFLIDLFRVDPGALTDLF